MLPAVNSYCREGALKNNGFSGKVLTVQGEVRQYGGLFSKRLNKVVSTNGRHLGVEVDGRVFDNLSPNGVAYEEWLDDLVDINRMPPNVINVEGF